MIFMHNGLSRQVSMCCLSFCHIHIQYIHAEHASHKYTKHCLSSPYTLSCCLHTCQLQVHKVRTHIGMCSTTRPLYFVFLSPSSSLLFIFQVLFSICIIIFVIHICFSIITQFVFKMYTYSSIF